MTFNFLTIDIEHTIIALGKLAVIPALVTISMMTIRWAMTYERRHRKNMQQYNDWYDQVVNCPNPARQDLRKLAKIRARKSQTFRQALQEKLASYERTTNTIEATMSPVQLYEIGNPLWTKELSINAIRGFLMLHKLATQENVNPHDYLEAYVADVRGGTSVSEAYDKQEANINYHSLK